MVTSMLARTDPVPYSELMSQMLSFESRLDILQGGSGGGSQSSANSASRGNNRNSGNREPSSRGRGPSWRGCGAGGRGRGASNSGGQKAHFNGQCQVCFKEGHNATYCWHRFDANYVPEEKHTTLPLITMTLTATGTRTLVQQIISPVSMIN
jgi:hypothetical protein